MFPSFAILVLYLLTTSAGMRETCTSQGVHYANRATFNSVKQDGSQYSCACSGYQCQRISCTRRSGTTRTENPPDSSTDDDDTITGEVPGSSNNNNRPVVSSYPSRKPVIFPIRGRDTTPIRVIGATGSCYDQKSGRNFARGSSFIRLSQDGIQQSCTCPLSGPANIHCKVAGCKLPDPPRRTQAYSSHADGTGCFDLWNNRYYRSGTRYNRTRYMDASRRITGVYSCSCVRNMMRCSAVDIPCCNLATGEFAPPGERFVTLYRGEKMTCTCEGKRGRFSRCLRDGLNPFGPGGRLIPSRSSSYGSRSSGNGCIDKYTGVHHYPNQRWYQDRGNLGTWNCKCQLDGNVYRTTCQFYSV